MPETVADTATADAQTPRRTRFRSSDGVQLVADELGPDDAPTVILLHGGGQTRHSWSGAMHALAGRGYRVINFDARGHGDSDWSSDGAYALEHRAADLRAITTTLNRPFALVGASLGGVTSIHAIAGGMTPAALVLVDIVPNPEPKGIERIINFMRGNPDGFASLDEAVDAVSAYNPERPRPANGNGLMRNLRLRGNGRLYWHWDPRTVSAGPSVHQETVEKSTAVMAARGDVPVLVVRGMKSDVVSDAGIAAFRAMLPGLEVVDVSGAGHMVAGDRNDAFNAGVIGFLQRHLPAA